MRMPIAADHDAFRSPAAVLGHFALALAFFTAAIGASILFRDFLRPHVFLFFFTAVACSAWLSGFWPALLVSVLSVLAADFLFIPPTGELRFAFAKDVVSLLSFLVVSAIISSITARLRLARQQAEREAERQELASRELRTALEHLPIGIWIADPAGRVVYGNPAGRRIWAGEAFAGAETPDGPKAWQVDTGEPVRAGEWALARALRNREASFNEELEIEALDGTRKIINSAAVPILGARGELLGAVVVNEDITSRKLVERSLREATERLGAIIRASPLAILAMDVDRRVEAWNPAAERMFGWPEAEVIGRPTPIVPEEQRREVDREFELALQGEVFTGLETERLRKDGSRVFVSVSTAPVRAADGTLLGVMALYEDITQRRRVERERRRLSAILEATPDIVATVDPEDLRLLYLNRAGRERLGVPEDADAVDFLATDFLPAEQAEMIRKEAVPVAVENGTWSGELQILSRDGRRIPVLAVIIAHKRPDGRVEYLSTLARDIGQRKRAEESQRLLAEVGRILAASLDYEEAVPTIARLVVGGLADGCAVDLLENGTVRRLAIAHAEPDVEERVRQLELKWPLKLRPASVEAEVLSTAEPALIREVTDADLRRFMRGEEHFHAIRAMGLRSIMVVPLNARGRTFGAILLTSDVSGRVFDEEDLATAQALALRVAFAIDNSRLYAETRDARAEAERRAKEEQAVRLELERVMESRARLVRGFSHDVKNPLGAADGYLELLEMGVRGELSPEQREGVERSRRSIHSALQLIDDLVDLARAEAGHIEVERRALDLVDLAQDAAEEARAAAEAKGLRITFDAARDVPPIASDAARIRQILGNLLANATKYTDAGGITVWAGVREDGAAPGPGRWAVVDVTDTGPGIPEDQQARVFEEFVRLEPAEKWGAGIGLAISRRTARALGGDLTVTSEVGKGSTFTLWLPTDDPGRGADGDAAEG
ncbi:MAG TPA: PAS domain S-box protein [Longimicrobiales bacterium]